MIDANGDGEPALIERAEELAALRDVLGSAGGVAVVEAPPGLGKSRLLDQALASAEREGVIVARARGTEIERELPFGVVSQLFQPMVATLPTKRRDALLGGVAGRAASVLGLGPADGPPPDTPTVLHGLFWLAVALAGEAGSVRADAPALVLALDDAHWADAPSLTWIAYLAQRLENVPVALILAARDEDPGVAQLDTLRARRDVRRVVPTALSADGVGRVVAAVFGTKPDRAFAAAIHEATGGNPLFVVELATALSQERLAPRAEAVAAVRTTAPRSVGESVRHRLEGLSEAAVPVAHAVAVLAEHARSDRVLTMAGIDEGLLARAHADLVRIGLFERSLPPRFIHPVVRAAVEADMDPAARDHANRLAAELMLAGGESPLSAAPFLVKAEPRGDPSVVATLRSAGRAAAARGGAGAGVEWLRRALEEPPTPADRAGLLLELGRAEAGMGDPAAADRLEEVVATAASPSVRAQAATTLGLAHTWAHRPDAALDLLDEQADSMRADDPELALQLETLVLNATRVDSRLGPRTRERLARHTVPRDPTTAGQRSLLGHFAMESAMAARSAADVTALARATLAGPVPAPGAPELPLLIGAARALAMADGLSEARAWLDALVEAATEAGDPQTYVGATTIRADVSLRLGDLRGAEADARGALDALPAPMPLMEAAAAGLLAEAMLERGDAAGAQAVLDVTGLTGELPPIYSSILVLWVRGRLHAAAGRTAAARRDLDACAAAKGSFGEHNPGVAAPEPELAVLSLSSGDRQRAVATLEPHVEAARAYGAPRALGSALRAMGLVAGGDAGLALLRDAVAVLEGSESRLEEARGRADLGSALRRAGLRPQAREQLRAALDRSTELDAGEVAARAREELVAAGAKPRRLRTSGPDALTPSELRVARMAADGATNRVIGQRLFVTPKTVERHLSRAFRKLGVTGRAQLADALARDDPDDRNR